MRSHPHIFLSAGEASGDHYGAQIIAELSRRTPAATFTGLGGKEMEEAGQTRVVRAEDVAHMGITEVLRHMPRVFGEYRKLVALIEASRPDIAILIDFPDVNFRLAKHCKRLGIPVVWFVSPQLWAWKRRRLRWVRQRVSKMIVIFPFEEPFYRARGVDAQFVGHPLAALPLPDRSREEYAAQYHLDPTREWIALLPGSRQREIEAHVDTLIETVVARDRRDWSEYLLPVASTADPEWLSSHIENWVRHHQRELKSVPRITLVPDAREAMFHARASVVASGTATVQALVVGNPFVVIYKVSTLSFALAKRLIRYPREITASRDSDGNLPVAMVNLIAGRRIVPELLNDKCTVKDITAALRPLVHDGPARRKMIEDLATARVKLLPNAAGKAASPIELVCDVVDKLLRPEPALEALTSAANV